MFFNLDWTLYRCHLEIPIHHHGDSHCLLCFRSLASSILWVPFLVYSLLYWIITSSSLLKVQGKDTREGNDINSCMPEIFYPYLTDGLGEYRGVGCRLEH